MIDEMYEVALNRIICLITQGLKNEQRDKEDTLQLIKTLINLVNIQIMEDWDDPFDDETDCEGLTHRPEGTLTYDFSAFDNETHFYLVKDFKINRGGVRKFCYFNHMRYKRVLGEDYDWYLGYRHNDKEVKERQERLAKLKSDYEIFCSPDWEWSNPYWNNPKRKQVPFD